MCARLTTTTLIHMSSSSSTPVVLVLAAAVAAVMYSIRRFSASSARAPRAAISVRSASSHDDEKAFLEMWKEYCVYFKADSSHGSNVYARMKAEGGLLLAVTANTNVVAGFVTFIEIPHTFSRAMYVEDLFVRASHRNQGVGRALLEAAVTKAKQNPEIRRVYGHALEHAESRFLYAKVARLTPLVRYQIEL
jgi:GNAT superfamily N-acetyltransferase